MPVAGKGVCGHKGKVNMLMLGMNLPEGGLQGANAIRLVVVDYDQPSVRILALPPNLWVKTTTLKDVDATLLTMAFAYGQVPPPLGNPTAVRNATQVVAQALLDNFGYNTEKYLTLNQAQFKNLVDTLDGVEVNVLEYADGTPEGFGIYEPGLQSMNGQRALEYIRLEQTAGQPPNEWSRLSRQNQVIKGIQNDLLKPENWIQIPGLINDFYRLLVTNLSPKELLDLNCMIAEVGGNITVLEVTPEMVIDPSDAVLIPDEAAIRALILELQAGS
jgi:anionic cell wall polymer biosynthesis LytR-Cps2A-Psr (LCP) family protein